MESFDYSAIIERNIGFLTEEEQRKIKGSTVLVAGLGGVGGATAICLARLGVGHLILAEFDTYTISNINRQEPSTTAVLDREKLTTVVDHIHAINPSLTITQIKEGITAENMDELQQKSDLCISAMDSYMTMFFMDGLKRNNTPGLWCSPILNSVILNYFPADGYYLSDVYPFEISDDAALNQKRYIAFLETVLRAPIYDRNYFSVISPGIHTAVGFLGYQAVHILTGREVEIPAFPGRIYFNCKKLQAGPQLRFLTPLFWVLKRVPFANWILRKLLRKITKSV